MFARYEPPGSSRADRGTKMRLAGLAILAIAPIILSACATGVAGSARRICYNTGLQPGTPEFSSCWKGVRNQQFAKDGQMVEGLVAAAVVVGAAKLTAEGATTATLAPTRLKKNPLPA